GAAAVELANEFARQVNIATRFFDRHDVRVVEEAEDGFFGHRNDRTSWDIIDDHRTCAYICNRAKVLSNAFLGWFGVVRNDRHDRVDLGFLSYALDEF